MWALETKFSSSVKQLVLFTTKPSLQPGLNGFKKKIRPESQVDVEWEGMDLDEHDQNAMYEILKELVKIIF